MSSAFQLSSAYRPYRPPPTEASTIAAGMSEQDHGDQQPSRPAVGERGRVTNEQGPQGPAPNQGLERCQQQHPQQHEHRRAPGRAGGRTAARQPPEPIPATTCRMRRRRPEAGRPDGGDWCG